MGKSSDQLREEIDQQREDAGARIDHLQEQVQQQAEGARDQAIETAEQVRGEAKALANDAIDTVKENVDFHQQIQQRPLLSAGAALVGGFLLGSMMGGNGQHHQQSGGTYSSGANSGGGPETSGVVSGVRSVARKSGLDETLSNAGAALMGSMTEQVKLMLDQTFPGFSQKLDTAEEKPGSFTDKAKATQHEAQQA